MSKLNFKKEVSGTVDEVVSKVTEALKPKGFGMLTRIDFDTKIKEKLNKDISKTVILGACNPALALEAFQKNTDVTSLIPCNVVVRELGNNRVSVEMAKPSFMMEILGEMELAQMAKGADADMQAALETL